MEIKKVRLSVGDTILNIAIPLATRFEQAGFSKQYLNPSNLFRFGLELLLEKTNNVQELKDSFQEKDTEQFITTPKNVCRSFFLTTEEFSMVKALLREISHNESLGNHSRLKIAGYTNTELTQLVANVLLYIKEVLDNPDLRAEKSELFKNIENTNLIGKGNDTLKEPLFQRLPKLKELEARKYVDKKFGSKWG